MNRASVSAARKNGTVQGRGLKARPEWHLTQTVSQSSGQPPFPNIEEIQLGVKSVNLSMGMFEKRSVPYLLTPARPSFSHDDFAPRASPRLDTSCHKMST